MVKNNYRIGLVLPDVLGLYGDSGNAVVLRQRLKLRGINAEIVNLTLGDEIPDDLDIYTLGGAEDIAQQTAVKHLKQNKGLETAIKNGVPVLAICAATQILGNWYKTLDGTVYPGLEITNTVSNPMEKRAIGELVVEAVYDNRKFVLTGFENHRGNTEILAPAKPLGKVLAGVGNGNKVDGTHQYNIYGTYMHGPVLARNPEFADFLIEKMTGMTELEPIFIPEMEMLKQQRLKAAGIS